MSKQAENEDQKILRLVNSFESVFDDVEVRHAAEVSHPNSAALSVSSLLGRSKTVCLPIQQEICASLCLQCDHFIGIQRGEDGSVILRCWTHKARRRVARGTQTHNTAKAVS